MKNTAPLTPRAFTLVETLVAITILTLAVAGPLFTASRAIVAAQGARYQLIASHLAQEGIEYVRVMRDDAYLYHYGLNPLTASTEGWNDFTNGNSSINWSINQCSKNSINKACTLDPSELMCTANNNCSLKSCKADPPGNTCQPLYLTPLNTYTQRDSGNVLTPFTRTIQAGDISLTEEIATSTVSWSFHGTDYSVSITDHLTSWQ